MTSRILVTLALVSAAATVPVSAQNLHLSQSQAAKYAPPLCPIRAINKNVEKGLDQLKKAYDAKTPADRATLLSQAKQNIVGAITQESQGQNAAAWYYLGRVALLQGDARGADSAFARAEELQPACEIDINQYRQNGWAAVANAAIELQKNDNRDSALALFREANYLYRKMPHVYFNMGVMFANANTTDSAVIYFAKALEVAESDTAFIEDRNGAALNLAVMQGRAGQHTESIATLRKYLTWVPDDTDARKTLAHEFRQAGMEDSATALETAMVEQFTKANLDSLEMQDVLAVGVLAFNSQRYPEAENAFKKALERNPWSRDARYNLANTHFAVGSRAKSRSDSLKQAKADTAAIRASDAEAVKHFSALVREGTPLLELEPLSEDVLRLIAQGQRALKQDEAVLKTAERLLALPLSIEVTGFQMGQNRAKFIGEATGRSPMDAKGNPLKTAPVTVVLEFLDIGGKVVATQEVPIPVLKEGQKQALEAEGAGEGITGWRYRVK